MFSTTIARQRLFWTGLSITAMCWSSMAIATGSRRACADRRLIQKLRAGDFSVVTVGGFSVDIHMCLGGYN